MKLFLSSRKNQAADNFDIGNEIIVHTDSRGKLPSQTDNHQETECVFPHINVLLEPVFYSY